MVIRASIIASFFVFLAGIAHPQTGPLACQPTAVNPVVRAEGITEQLGDILLSCSGSTAGNTIQLNYAIFLNVGITNRINANSVTDVTLTVDSGSGPVPSTVPGILQTSNSVSFNGVSFVVPPSREVFIRVSNLRGNVSQFGPGSQRAVLATLSVNGGSTTVTVPTEQVSVGIPATGLLATLSDTGIRCTGSLLPDQITFNNLIGTGTRYVSTRVTEGFVSAFEKKSATSDTGVRIVARYAGLPSGARLFIPDVIAGSNAVQPTAGGDFGGTISGGAYAPGVTGSLLLVRVRGADANGAGGTLVYTPDAPGSGTVAFNAIGEIALSGGAGIGVYEVVDSNPSVRETAQFPTFLGLAPIPDGAVGPIASETVSLGPISTALTATTGDPIPRFLASTPPSDCPSLNDCNAAYFPEISVGVSRPLEFTAPAGSFLQTKTVQIRNVGGGVLNWTATVTGIAGAGGVTVAPSSGVNNGTVLVNVFPDKLAPGVYTGSLLIEGGPLAGSRSVPIKATITNGPVIQIPPDVFPLVTVTGLRSAARPDSSAVAPGSLANVIGSRLKGTNVSVTFDGVAARIVTPADDFITLQIPESLTAPQSAQLEVVVDGAKSNSLAVQISDFAPAIFPTGILNENFSANSASNPAAVGSTLQILATGLKAGDPVVVKLHDRTLTPSSAGPFEGLVGIGMVRVAIPTDLPAMTTYFFICSANPGSQVCSQAGFVTLK